MTALTDDTFFIPTSFRAAVSIRNAAESPDVDELSLERMVCAEPIVAAALLRIVNSAAYRRGGPVESVSVAVRLLGLAKVRAIASQVAMLQLVRGIRGRAARMTAEALLLHSISIARFAQHLGGLDATLDAERLSALGLFHELPTFLFLAGSNRDPSGFEHLSDISQRLARSALRSYELVMQDLGLPGMAIPSAAETQVLARAHAYVSHPNPLQVHPAESWGDGAIDPVKVAVLQAEADAGYVLLIEGPVPREDYEIGHPMIRDDAIPRNEQGRTEPAQGRGWVARLQRRLRSLLGNR